MQVEKRKPGWVAFQTPLGNVGSAKWGKLERNDSWNAENEKVAQNYMEILT